MNMVKFSGTYSVCSSVVNKRLETGNPPVEASKTGSEVETAFAKNHDVIDKLPPSVRFSFNSYPSTVTSGGVTDCLFVHYNDKNGDRSEIKQIPFYRDMGQIKAGFFRKKVIRPPEPVEAFINKAIQSVATKLSDIAR